MTFPPASFGSREKYDAEHLLTLGSTFHFLVQVSMASRAGWRAAAQPRRDRPVERRATSSAYREAWTSAGMSWSMSFMYTSHSNGASTEP